MPNRWICCLSLLGTLAFTPALAAQGELTGRGTVTLLPADEDASVVVGTRYRLAGTGSGAAAPLLIRWRPADLPGGVRGSELEVAHRTVSGWIALPGATIAGDSAVVPDAGVGDYEVRWRAPAVACTDSAHRLLDYRLGKWDYRAPGYDPGRDELLEAHSRCALFDHYVDVNGGRSDAFLLYRADESQWYVTTNDSDGRSIMRGIATADSAIFNRQPAPGDTMVLREVYRKRKEGGVLFTLEQSGNRGRSWQVIVTATYTRVREE